MKIHSKSLKSLLFCFILLVLIQTQAQTSHPSNPADITLDRNGVLLKGKFHAAQGTGPFPTVVLLSGFPGNQTDVLGLGALLSEEGFNVLTFNYSGTHESQGEFSFENSQKDIHAAFDFLSRSENISRFKVDSDRIYLGGWSFGGGMAIAYAARHPEIKAVFSIAGNDHGEFFRQYSGNPEMKKMIDRMFEEMKAPKGVVRFEEGSLPKEIAEEGLENLDPSFDFKKCAPILAQKHILLIGGWDDWHVPFDLIIFPFYKAMKKEKAGNVLLVGLQDDHYFKKTRDQVAETLIQWLETELGK